MIVRYATVTGLSHPGLMREHNEDSLVAGPWTLCGTVTASPQTLLFPLAEPLVVAVADGIGGQVGGEIASALVVQQLAATGSSLEDEDAVRDAVRGCNRAVYAAADRDPGLATMGTTLAGVVVLPDALLAFNVGDSRVLEATAADGLRRLSVDDSPPLLPGERSTSLVTQALGGGYRFTEVTPHVATEQLAAESRYLVCTDGLTDLVPEETIDGLLRSHKGGRAAFELWKTAIEAGGSDNITLALITTGTDDEGEGEDAEGDADEDADAPADEARRPRGDGADTAA